jgi:hypothetical protein
MLKNLYIKYIELICLTKPPKYLKVLRFILHWLTIPIKLMVIGSMGTYQIIRQEFFTKRRKVPPLPSHEIKLEYFNSIKSKLPVLKTAELELYVNRVPYYEQPQKWNFNSDHQASRHGVYCFLNGILGTRVIEQDVALCKHLVMGQLARGYKWNPFESMQIVYNQGSVSGDMLIGVSLAMTNLIKEKIEEGTHIQGYNGFLKERYDEMLYNIIENDYSLLEYVRPDKEDPQQALWDKAQIHNEKAIPSQHIKIKSIRGMWQPGLETVGAQALTILAALRIGDKILGASYAKKEYRRMLFRYGYGLLSLFPTAFVKSQRGYFNDHNCITSLYILSSLAETKLGRFFWKIPMLYTWMLSRTWYNGYFTGLVEKAHPGTISQSYLDKCKAYLYEDKPLTYSYAQSASLPANEYPVKFNDMSQDEFYPDMPHELLVPTDLDDESKRQVLSGIEKYRSGLGWLACAVLLEKDAKNVFNT